MTFIRTVLGDISPTELGACDAHEHIVIERSYATEHFPHLLLDSTEKAVTELTNFYLAGGRAMIDAMPANAGRNASKLAEISRRTNVHIISATGLHLQKYYPHGHWSERMDARQLAAAFCSDIQIGIDRNDYGGIDIDRTDHRAGVIKIAGGLDGLSDWERQVFEAGAITHDKTGAPLLTHTEKGTAAIEQIKILQDLGVSPRRVTLSHTDRRPDVDYHKEILSTGVNVEFDGAARWRLEDGNPTCDLIVELFAAGFGSQIMLGMDAARSTYWKSYGGSPGLSFLLVEFSASLRVAGLGSKDLAQIFVENPARAFAFAELA